MDKRQQQFNPTTINTATFEEVLRRCVARQKKAFLLYETCFGFNLLVLLISFINCAFNLLICFLGLDKDVISDLLPFFLRETVSPPTSSFLTFFPLSSSAAHRICFNQPLNFFWCLNLRPDLVLCGSLICAVSMFLIVRGVFALRRPQKYITGLNAILKREYGWRFDEKVGRLIVLPKA